MGKQIKRGREGKKGKAGQRREERKHSGGERKERMQELCQDCRGQASGWEGGTRKARCQDAWLQKQEELLGAGVWDKES